MDESWALMAWSERSGIPSRNVCGITRIIGFESGAACANWSSNQSSSTVTTNDSPVVVLMTAK